MYLEASLEQVPHAAMPDVEVSGVTAVEQMHPRGEIPAEQGQTLKFNLKELNFKV